jgi:hypothetical protein
MRITRDDRSDGRCQPIESRAEDASTHFPSFDATQRVSGPQKIRESYSDQIKMFRIHSTVITGLKDVIHAKKLRKFENLTTCYLYKSFEAIKGSQLYLNNDKKDDNDNRGFAVEPPGATRWLIWHAVLGGYVIWWLIKWHGQSFC